MKFIFLLGEMCILFFTVLIIFGCKKNNISGEDAIAGKWTLNYQISFSSPEASGTLTYHSFTPSYDNDTFDITFSKGNYTGVFPSYYVVNNTVQTLWLGENGTYAIHDNELDISTMPSESLHDFLHLGFPVGMRSTTIFKKLSSDKLLILSTYGKMNVNPFGFDSTILIRH
ncbi:MAG: hypothetical protein JST75_17100 [Bacteroidetes bacterium]|nr:hypothetical protein [Bacteroidota bacterium]